MTNGQSTNAPTLTSKQRIIIGGCAAMLPFLAATFLVDRTGLLFKDPSFVSLLGWIARAAFLFAVGGFIAYLHTDEHSPPKVFNIGLGAPAMLVAVATGAQFQQKPGSQSLAEFEVPAASRSAGLGFFPEAYAQQARPEGTNPRAVGPDPQPNVGARKPPSLPRMISPPEETNTDKFLRGFLGSYSRNSWYVVVGNFATVEEAQKAAGEIDERKKNPQRQPGKFQRPREFTPEIVALPEAPGRYSVALGQQLRWADAEDLRVDLQDLGITSNARLVDATASAAK